MASDRPNAAARQIASPGRLSPESVARSIKKITPELLTITEPEVSFRKRGPDAGVGLLPGVGTGEEE
jgi:hypothetical protein